MSEELNIDEQIAQIDASIEEQNVRVARGKDLAELIKDPKFQSVMIDGYLNEEANRVFNLLTSPRVSKPEEIQSYMSQLDTIKNIGRYLGDGDYPGTIAILAANPKKEIDSLNAMKQELITPVGE